MVTPYLLVIILLRILLLRILPLAVTQYTTTSLEPACCTEQDATEPDLPPEDEGIPWLPARILEIPLSYLLRSATEGYPVLGKVAIRFDALLLDQDDLENQLLAFFTGTENAQSEHHRAQHPNGTRTGLRRHRVHPATGRGAIAIAVADQLRSAARTIHDDIEAEIAGTTARGVEGDWLASADATCNEMVLRRRREILELYSKGKLHLDTTECSRLKEKDGDTTRCVSGIAGNVVMHAGLTTTEHLSDSASSLIACRVLFDASEVEYANAACLRAVRLGGMSIDDAVETDMRLAAAAYLHGHESNALKIYFGIMGQPFTNENGRLVMSILGLTMVPPLLIGSTQRVTKFRQDWTSGLRRLRYNLREGRTKVGRTPFYLVHQGESDIELMRALVSVYDAAAPSLRFVAPHCDGGVSGNERVFVSDGGEAGRRPARIGFFSVHLRDHSIGRMMLFLIVGLCQDPDFEVHVFGSGDKKKQNNATAGSEIGGDAVVGTLQAAVQHWHKAPTTLDEARRAVSEQQLDILVYPDIGMEPLTYFMAFSRLAPVQCVWWGHPATPATGAIDYFLSLDVELDQAQDNYVEQMVRMDIVNTAPFQQTEQVESRRHLLRHDGADIGSTGEADEAPRLLVMVPSGEAERLGVTASEPTLTGCIHEYLILGRLFKLHPDFDTAVREILERDPAGCIVLIHETLNEDWTRAVWKRLTDKLRSVGLEQRLRIIHHWNYPEALRRASVVLDTFPYSGCLTVLEGLSNTVPVVTLPSDLIQGRFALAIYRQMGYSDLVAADLKEYVALAAELGINKEFREIALGRVEDGYRSSLHQNAQSAEEWAVFFRRVFQATMFDEVAPYQ